MWVNTTIAATVVAEIAQNQRTAPWPLLRLTLLGVARNPVVMAVLVAMIWSTLALPVPGAARRTLELLGAAAPPVAAGNPGEPANIPASSAPTPVPLPDRWNGCR